MYIKSVDGFLYDMDHDPDSAVYRVLRETTAASDQSSEQRSWAKSLPQLAKVLSPLPAAVRSGCQIVLEAKYESEERRADVVLVGTQQGRPSLLIIENKRWSNLDRYRPDGQHSVWDPYHNCMTCHPARQVEHYKTTLEYHNQFVQDNGAKIRTMVFLQNATLAEKQAKSGPFAERYRALYPQTPMFTGEETAEMTAFIAGCFDGCSDTGLAQQIYSSPVRDSSDYRLLLENWSCRRKQLLDELDEEQIALFDEISQVVWSGNERRVFLVHGKRGTGKTFVAIALLAYLYRSRGMQIRYLERNRDPRKILETYFEVPWWAMGNLPENVPNNCDCLICDESHRFWEYARQTSEEPFLDVCLRKSRVVVFFYDESQRIHVSDHVTPDGIRTAMEKCGLDPALLQERYLTQQHRCKNGDRFLDAVDRLLDHPELGLDGLGPFCETDPYQVALVNDPQELFQLIREKNGQKGAIRTSRVLAGKGRSYGRDWSWDMHNTDYCGGKTIAPLRNSDEALFTWNLNYRNYKDDKIFATDKQSVELAGCIDTSQGLDFEYVGVIIAPDLIYDPRLGQICVNVDGHQRSDPNVGNSPYADRPVNDSPEVRRIIRNTYRVLLSRGEKGCFIYCCDENLHRYLSRIITAPGAAKPDPSPWIN